MKTKLAVLAFCATLMSAPAYAAVGGARTAAPEMDAVRSALLQAGGESLHAQGPVAGTGVPQGEGSPFGPVKLSSAPSVCAGPPETRAVFYYYSGSAPAPSLPACTAEGPAVTADLLLPVLTITDAFLGEAALEPDLPEIPIVVNKSVESFIRYFQTNGRRHFEKWLDRSADYMSMLHAILRENGLPEDLSYIALIESGLNPTVRSRANAVGMWQFIKGTATRYGLRVDWWIDERMDPEKATYAAARYFKNLYGMFGSWYLAAAGYNGGEGRVARAIKKHGTEDFWELTSQRKQPLHRETREYVPKYLAALTIAKDPESYGFNAVAYADGLRYDKVQVAQATDLRIIAEAAGTTIEEIKKLNPELLRWFTPPNYPGYEVKIPAGMAQVYRANMVKIPTAKRIAFVQHKVRRGETLSNISRKYGTGTKPILYLNNNINPQKIRPGTVLVIPVRAGDYTSKKNKPVAVADIITRMEIRI